MQPHFTVLRVLQSLSSKWIDNDIWEQFFSKQREIDEEMIKAEDNLWTKKRMTNLTNDICKLKYFTMVEIWNLLRNTETNKLWDKWRYLPENYSNIFQHLVYWLNIVAENIRKISTILEGFTSFCVWKEKMMKGRRKKKKKKKKMAWDGILEAP